MGGRGEGAQKKRAQISLFPSLLIRAFLSLIGPPRTICARVILEKKEGIIAGLKYERKYENVERSWAYLFLLGPPQGLSKRQEGLGGLFSCPCRNTIFSRTFFFAQSSCPKR